MAVDIDLEVFSDASETKRIGLVYLYFGNALNTSSWAGWDWVRDNGMSVDPPNVLDNKNAKRGKIIPKETLMEWINNGYLTSALLTQTTSPDFLNAYPANAVFRLSFLDWS